MKKVAFLFHRGVAGLLLGTFMRDNQEALEGSEHMMFSFTLVPLGSFLLRGTHEGRT
jgi:hypothetical protein